MFSNRTGIILACDVDTLEALGRLAQLAQTCPAVSSLKIGCTLALRHGLRTSVRAAKEYSDLPIIYDHQKAATDIPDMGLPFAQCCAEAGVSGVILFPQAGPATLQAFVSGLTNHKLTPIVGGLMTHANYLERDGGFLSDEAPEKMYRLALELGVSHFVAPGNKPDMLRIVSALIMSKIPDAAMLMPGIGSQGGEIGAAMLAIEPLRGYPIIGSAIYRADSPEQALARFAEAFKQATSRGK